MASAKPGGVGLSVPGRPRRGTTPSTSRPMSASSSGTPLALEGKGNLLRQSGRAVVDGSQRPSLRVSASPSASSNAVPASGSRVPVRQSRHSTAHVSLPVFPKTTPVPPPAAAAPVQDVADSTLPSAQRVPSKSEDATDSTTPAAQRTPSKSEDAADSTPPAAQRVPSQSTQCSVLWDQRLSHPALNISEDGMTVWSTDTILRGQDGELQYTRAAFGSNRMTGGDQSLSMVYESGYTAWLCLGVFDPTRPEMKGPNGSPIQSWVVNDVEISKGSTHEGCWLYSFFFDKVSADGDHWTDPRPQAEERQDFEEGDEFTMEISLPKGDLNLYRKPAGDLSGGRAKLAQMSLPPDRPYQVIALLGGQNQRLRIASAHTGRPPWIPIMRPPARHPLPALRDTAMRGISLQQLTELGHIVKDGLDKHEVLDTNPRSATVGESITWENATMYHVCEHFVLPLTKAYACSYVELVAQSSQAPQWMVSHAWSTHFPLTVNMLTSHAKSRGRSACMGTIYWCCTLANNQHDLSELQQKDIMKSPFARVLLSQECTGTVLLCDLRVTPMRRCWCVFETYLSERLRDRTLASKGLHFLDVAATVTAAPSQQPKERSLEPEEGSEENEVRGHATSAVILQDAVGGNWHEVAEVEGHFFPLEVATAGTEVDIVASKASVTADRNAILNFVAIGKALRSEVPPESHEEYDDLNLFIHNVFASAELYRLATDRPQGCLDSMVKLLEGRADPNRFVRQGNTTLFAAVGADPTSRSATPTEDVGPVLEVLLGARADPNCLNSQMDSVLDAASGLSEANQALLRSYGAKPTEEVAAMQKDRANEELQRVVSKGFPSEREAFGGTGGGGNGAKLMRCAEQCLLEVACMLKRFPNAPCCIETKRTKQDKLRLRGSTVRRFLEEAGCTNPMELHSSDHGPLLELAFLSLQSSPAVPDKP